MCNVKSSKDFGEVSVVLAVAVVVVLLSGVPVSSHYVPNIQCQCRTVFLLNCSFNETNFLLSLYVFFSKKLIEVGTGGHWGHVPPEILQ